MKWFSSLRSRISLLLLAMVLPVLFILSYSAHEQRQSAEKALKRELATDVSVLSALLAQKVEGARALLISLSHSPAILNRDSASCDEFLAHILKHNPQYTNLGATDPDGNVFCSAIPMTKPVNASDKAWFQRTIKSTDIAVGDYQIGRIVDKPVIIMGFAAGNESDNTQAAVFVPFDLTELSRIPEQIRLPESTAFLVLDRNGAILSHAPDHEKWVGKTINKSEIAKAILTEHEGTVKAEGVDGIKRLYSFTSVAGTDNSMFISIGIPEDIALADIKRQFTRNLILVVIFTALSFAAVLIISRMARQSETKLVKSVEQYQDLYDHAPNGYVSVGTDGLIKRYNKRFGEMLGYETATLLGMPVVHLYADTPDGKGKAKKVFQRFLSAETISGEELEMRKADGTWLWVSLSVNSVRDPQGLIMESRSIVQDITERKKRDDELKITNEELLFINRIITTTTTTTGVKEVLENVLDEALDITGLEGGTICMVTPDNTLRLAAQRETSEATIIDLTTNEIKIGECLCGKCAQDHKPLILMDRTAVLEFSSREAQRGEDIRFHAAFPLVIGAGCLGVLCVFTRTDKKPLERSLKLIEGITAQIAMSIETTRRYEEIVRHTATLENKVKERTAELETKIAEIERMNRLFVGRELRLRELKERIKELEFRSQKQGAGIKEKASWS